MWSCVDNGSRDDGDHIGTRQRLSAKTRVACAPVGVVNTPPKVGSCGVPTANVTLKPALYKGVRDKILSFDFSNTSVVPYVANVYGFFAWVKMGKTTSAISADT